MAINGNPFDLTVQDFSGQATPDQLFGVNQTAAGGVPSQGNFDQIRQALMAQQGGTAGQADAMSLMRAAATGQGPSIAQAQMNSGLSQAASNAQAMAAANRGQGGLGALNAMNAGALAAGQASGAGAVARAQEQLGNMQNYGNAVNAQAQLGQNALVGAGNVLSNYTQAQQQQKQFEAALQQKQLENQAGGMSTFLSNFGKIGQGAGKVAGGIIGAL